jgi:hypothetical protein
LYPKQIKRKIFSCTFLKIVPNLITPEKKSSPDLDRFPVLTQVFLPEFVDRIARLSYSAVVQSTISCRVGRRQILTKNRARNWEWQYEINEIMILWDTKK